MIFLSCFESFSWAVTRWSSPAVGGRSFTIRKQDRQVEEFLDVRSQEVIEHSWLFFVCGIMLPCFFWVFFSEGCLKPMRKG